MDHWNVIDELACEMGVKEAARDKWRVRGVAHKWRLRLMAAARDRGIELSEADFEPINGNVTAETAAA